jgi:predicted Zn-dependent protease
MTPNIGERIIEALQNSPAPFADIRVERRETTHLIFRDGEPETIESRTDQGGIVRALSPDGGWGVVTFTRLAGASTRPSVARASFERRVRQAWEAAQASATPAARSPRPRLAPVSPVVAHVEARLAHDFRAVPLDSKRALVADFSAQLRSGHPCVRSTLVTYQDSFTQVHYTNTEGTYIYQEHPTIDLRLAIVARDGERVQQVEKSLALAAGFETVEHRSDLVRTVLDLGRDLLEAEPIRGGRYPVVMDPALAGLFVHEAFGHLSEADFIMADPSA